MNYRLAVVPLASWGGQKTSNLIAHISYRSMDALALLEAERAGIPVPFGRARIAELIETGYLYPFVSEGMSAPVKIPFHIARHYARSSLPWQFENQAWVLGGLIMSAARQ